MILSLGSALVLDLYPHRTLSPHLGSPTEPFCSIYMGPRALLIVRGDVYTKCLHGIAAVQQDVIRGDCANAQQAGVAPGDVIERQLRYSFTIRTVNRVVKSSLFKF